jgi:1,4-dihydroxy-2-naphthoate octaprenyltransferase
VLKKETLILLRMPFSIFLLPVFLFAWSQIPSAKWEDILVVFLLLHVLVYPASNGYNSYHDRDTESIGGLKSPPQPTRQLFWVVNGMDLLAILISLQFSFLFAAQVSGYILASRLYSNRITRLKRYPVLGFLWVSFFQGAFIYWAVQTALTGADSEHALFSSQPWAKLVASALLGAVYPLTQIYQHEADKRDGVRTMSMVLGYKGTFIFTAILFALANVGAWFHFQLQGSVRSFCVMQLFFIPVTLYFIYWFVLVWKDHRAADFDHAMRMNLLASMCLNLCYLSFILSQ